MVCEIFGTEKDSPLIDMGFNIIGYYLMIDNEFTLKFQNSAVVRLHSFYLKRKKNVFVVRALMIFLKFYFMAIRSVMVPPSMLSFIIV